MGSMCPMHESEGEVHLYCVWWKKPKGRKTAIYKVMKGSPRKSSGGVFLGTIQWWGAWRQYVFFPDFETLWSMGCLDMITKFLKKLNDRRKHGQNRSQAKR